MLRVRPVVASQGWYSIGNVDRNARERGMNPAGDEAGRSSLPFTTRSSDFGRSFHRITLATVTQNARKWKTA
jgi:hypothetical protein